MVVCIVITEPDGITTLVELVGMPPHQLPDTFQSPEAPPTHCPAGLTVTRIAAEVELQPPELTVLLNQVFCVRPVGEMFWAVHAHATAANPLLALVVLLSHE